MKMDYRFSERVGVLQPSAIREILKVTQDPSVLSFAAGNPAPETFPAQEMSVLAAEIFAKNASGALQYGVSEGYAPLIETTLSRLKSKLNVGRDFDRLIMLSGGQQGVELTAKIFLNEGDAVICEEPSFIGALNALRSYNVRLIGVACDSGGMDTEALEEVLKREKNVKLIYTIPTFQNPTGTVMTLERRKRMLTLAEEYNAVILEDNPYYELRYEGEDIPPIKALDEAGRVVYCGSYSKTIAPGIRLGFVCAPAEVVNKLTVVKQVSDVHSNLFFQVLVNEYLNRYDFDRHIRYCRSVYVERRDRLVAGLKANLSQAKWNAPQGGLFLWCVLPEGMDGFRFCSIAGQMKVAAVPGSSFLVDETASSRALRLNFSLPTPAQIDEGCLRLGEAMRKYSR